LPPDLSGQKWEVYKMPSNVISEEGYIVLVFVATLALFNYGLIYVT